MVAYTTQDGRILVEVQPNVSVTLEVAEAQGMISAEAANKVRLVIAKVEKKRGASVH